MRALLVVTATICALIACDSRFSYLNVHCPQLKTHCIFPTSRNVLTFHPDKNPSPEAQAAFIAISEAFSVLRDAAQRSAYDSELRVKETLGGPGGFADDIYAWNDANEGEDPFSPFDPADAWRKHKKIYGVHAEAKSTFSSKSKNTYDSHYTHVDHEYSSRSERQSKKGSESENVRKGASRYNHDKGLVENSFVGVTGNLTAEEAKTVSQLSRWMAMWREECEREDWERESSELMYYRERAQAAQSQHGGIVKIRKASLTGSDPSLESSGVGLEGGTGRAGRRLGGGNKLSLSSEIIDMLVSGDRFIVKTTKVNTSTTGNNRSGGGGRGGALAGRRASNHWQSGMGSSWPTNGVGNSGNGVSRTVGGKEVSVSVWIDASLTRLQWRISGNQSPQPDGIILLSDIMQIKRHGSQVSSHGATPHQSSNTNDDHNTNPTPLTSSSSSKTLSIITNMQVLTLEASSTQGRDRWAKALEDVCGLTNHTPLLTLSSSPSLVSSLLTSSTPSYHQTSETVEMTHSLTHLSMGNPNPQDNSLSNPQRHISASHSSGPGIGTGSRSNVSIHHDIISSSMPLSSSSTSLPTPMSRAPPRYGRRSATSSTPSYLSASSSTNLSSIRPVSPLTPYEQSILRTVKAAQQGQKGVGTGGLSGINSTTFITHPNQKSNRQWQGG